MLIGINLLLYTTSPDESIFPVCEKLQSYGYDGVEWPIFHMSKDFAKKVRNFNEENQFQATTNFNFLTDVSPISVMKSERDIAMRQMETAIEISAEIGSKLLCGPFVQSLGMFSGSKPTEREIDLCKDFLNIAGNYAEKYEVVLAVEYLNRFEMYMLNTALQVSEMITKVNHTNVKGMLDTFHANIEEDDLYTAIMQLNNQLAHIHISEHTRGIPGNGSSIRWDHLFQGLFDINYNGWLTIEAFHNFLPDLAVAAKIWRQLFKSPDELSKKGCVFIHEMISQYKLPNK